MLHRLFGWALVMTVAYTLIYIRRIKRKQRETLEAYLALIKLKDNTQPSHDISITASPTPLTPHQQDPVLERVMAYIEEKLSDSDANIGDMASAAAVSRSGLQRKLKQAMGITPQDLLREARIKRACQLLVQTDKSIADVAYSCGFTDPKYFGRCFKQSTGQSPTEYKTTHSV